MTDNPITLQTDGEFWDDYATSASQLVLETRKANRVAIKILRDIERDSNLGPGLAEAHKHLREASMILAHMFTLHRQLG